MPSRRGRGSRPHTRTRPPKPCEPPATPKADQTSQSRPAPSYSSHSKLSRELPSSPARCTPLEALSSLKPTPPALHGTIPSCYTLCKPVAACWPACLFAPTASTCTEPGSLPATSPQTGTLGHTCQHPLGTHRVQLLKRKHEPASSRETALRYPPSLCQAVLALVKHQVSTGELARLPLQPLPASPSVGPASILRPSICDGAGMHSTADHSSPGSKTSRLQSLRHAWLTWAHSLDLPKRISAHLMQGLPEHPLSENECLQAATMAHACLHPHCHSPECLSIAPDQPFRLQLLQLLATATNDPDEDIVQLMQQGVPTGAFGPLPASKQWPPAADMPDDDLAPPALLHCEGNWKRAEEHPEVLQALLAKEIEGGFVAAFDGSEEDAKACWPAGMQSASSTSSSQTNAMHA